MNRATDHFEEELRRLVDHFRYEYELSYGAAIGAMQIMCFDLCVEASQDDAEPEVTDA